MLTEFEHIMRCRDSASSPPMTRFQEDQTFTTEEKIEGVTRLPDSSSAVEMSMGLIAAGLFIYVKSDIVIEVYLGDPLTTTAIKTDFMVIATDDGDEFTEVHFKNNNGASTTATVEYYIAGEAT